MAGEWMAPAHRITSRVARGACTCPPASTPHAGGVGAVPLQGQGLHQGVADDMEVAAAPGGFQIAVIR